MKLPLRIGEPLALGLVAWCWAAEAATPPAGNPGLLQIRSLSVDGNPVAGTEGNRLRLPARGKPAFAYGPGTNSEQAPLRIRYRLDGYDSGWHEEQGKMRLSIRFRDANGEQAGEDVFKVFGQSDGWTGKPETSGFRHRQETVSVPGQATSLWVVMSSAGPPNTVGAYLITNLVVTALSSNQELGRVLVRFPETAKSAASPTDDSPTGWVRDGIRQSMAKVYRFDGENPGAQALFIADDDPVGHAEWRTAIVPPLPAVTPGEELLVTWDEAYSLGLQGPATASYPQLPAGFYRFHINELALMGTPTDTEASLDIEVPVTFWRTVWFWVAVVMAATALWAGGWRYLVWREMQRQLQVLEQQRAVERERVRIAQDIHDDLGTRVSQISMLTAAAQAEPSLSAQARGDFAKVTQMSRELVSAIYETVWAVNPENDTLDALADHICQVSNQLCSQAQLRCRLEVPELPPAIPLTSQVRHHLIMALKEAVHNIIRHARATEVRIRLELDQRVLKIAIRDDGCGFRTAPEPPGNGLRNLRRRLESVGGDCEVTSQPGAGTTVCLTLPLTNNL